MDILLGPCIATAAWAVGLHIAAAVGSTTNWDHTGLAINTATVGRRTAVAVDSTAG